MTERRRPIRRWIYAALALVGAGAVVGGLLLWARLAPWIERPKQPERDIERRWAAVRGWADADAPRGALGPLDELDADARTAGRALRHVLDGFGDDESPPPRILEAEVDGAAARTMARLEAWHRNEGGLGPPRCLEARPDALAALGAVRIALASAEAPDGDRMEAALALTDALQREGSLVQALVGDRLAVDAARVFADRGWPATDALRATRPRPEVLFTALVRDALCNEAMIRQAAGESVAGGWAIQAEPAVGDGDWPPLGLIDMRRERLVYRGHFGALLEAAHAHRDDYAAMADAMEPIEAEPPRSVFVRVMAIPMAERVRDAGETAARFDRLVESLPRRVEPPGEAGSAPAN